MPRATVPHRYVEFRRCTGRSSQKWTVKDRGVDTCNSLKCAEVVNTGVVIRKRGADDIMAWVIRPTNDAGWLQTVSTQDVHNTERPYMTHWFSEAGCDYCGFRVFSKGELTDTEDATLEFDDDEHGWSEVISPDWLIDNVPHYGD